MTIVLDHTIVPARDKEASARLFARIFGLAYEGPMGHFAPVRVNDALTLDFDNRDRFESHHYAFHVSDVEFDAIFDRIKAAGKYLNKSNFTFHHLAPTNCQEGAMKKHMLRYLSHMEVGHGPWRT